jgi:hypothetical protein
MTFVKLDTKLYEICQTGLLSNLPYSLATLFMPLDA